MIDALEYLSKTLKQTRKDQKLSQRTLSLKTGIPQPQISRIENAGVDLYSSNLVEMARALELEVMLVPRKQIRAVSALIQGEQNAAHGEKKAPQKWQTESLQDDA
jgi:predicted transcriptional regulator